MSPALLSKRLKDLEAAGVLKRTKPAKSTDLYEYVLTEAGLALKPIVDAVGDWGTSLGYDQGYLGAPRC